jgi:hypothetical protein
MASAPRLNPGSHEYERRALTTRPQRLVFREILNHRATYVCCLGTWLKSINLRSAVCVSLHYAISPSISNTEATVMWVVSRNLQTMEFHFIIAGRRLCPSWPQGCCQATSGADEELVTRGMRTNSSDASICIAFTAPFGRAKPLLEQWTQQTSIVWLKIM